MKKLFVSAILLMASASLLFSQTVEIGNLKLDLGNKKKRGYYNSTQVSLLMGSRDVTQSTSNSWTYYPNNIYYYNVDRYYLPPTSSYYYSTSKTAKEVQYSPSVTMVNGYMFNEHWSAGIGVGFELLENNAYPVFAEVKYTLWDNEISPYFAFKGGVSFSKDNNDYENSYYYGGNNDDNVASVLINPEIGVKFPLSNHADLLFNIAYRYQENSTTVETYSENYPYYDYLMIAPGGCYLPPIPVKQEFNNHLNRLSVGVAIQFR